VRHTLRRLAALLGFWTVSCHAWARILEFQATQVTATEVALSPNGHTLVFTMLGHLFSLPCGGGTAEQLTFGPSYDDDPVFSPDGSQVAFTSDRDGSEGNVFVLTLKDYSVVQLTHDKQAGRPTGVQMGNRSCICGMYAEPLEACPQ
jgi:Tol biopolymer transport system component